MRSNIIFDVFQSYTDIQFILGPTFSTRSTMNAGQNIGFTFPPCLLYRSHIFTLVLLHVTWSQSSGSGVFRLWSVYHGFWQLQLSGNDWKGNCLYIPSIQLKLEINPRRAIFAFLLLRSLHIVGNQTSILNFYCGI